jgi:hypothetical protein
MFPSPPFSSLWSLSACISLPCTCPRSYNDWETINNVLPPMKRRTCIICFVALPVFSSNWGSFEKNVAPKQHLWFELETQLWPREHLLHLCFVNPEAVWLYTKRHHSNDIHPFPHLLFKSLCPNQPFIFLRDYHHYLAYSLDNGCMN